MRGSFLFQSARCFLGLSMAAQAVQHSLQLSPQGLDFLMLAKGDVAQFSDGALQEGDLGLNLFQRFVVHAPV